MSTTTAGENTFGRTIAAAGAVAAAAAMSGEGAVGRPPKQAVEAAAAVWGEGAEARLSHEDFQPTRRMTAARTPCTLKTCDGTVKVDRSVCGGLSLKRLT